MKVIVIADDLSGAAEVAGAALHFGLSAEVHIGQLFASHADVIVVDSDSRSLCAKQAAAKVRELSKQAIEMQPDIIYKKVDSVLRGEVAAEIAAIREGFGFQQCVLACGNPRKKRIVVAGKIFIDGIPLHETGFADDPEHPRLTSDVGKLLGDCPATEIAKVSHADDLMNIARDWHLQRQSTLAAGGAEFFEAILSICCGHVHSSEMVEGENLKSVVTYGDVVDRKQPNPNVFLISGSSVAKVFDWPLVVPQESSTSEELAAEACTKLVTFGRAAIRAMDLKSNSPEDRLQQLTEVAVFLLATCRPTEVWIEGGRTASTTIRAIGYRRMVAVENAGDGLVKLRPFNEDSPLYLVKPGSYPWQNASGNEGDTALESAQFKRPAVASVDTAWRLPIHNVVRNILSLIVCCITSGSIKSNEPDFNTIKDILVEQCIDCHSADVREGTVDLERFATLADVDQDRTLWKTLFDVVEAEQMPLPQSGYELDENQRKAILEFARKSLARRDPALNAVDPGKPMLRRLTRLEYNNTIRDLFGLDYDIFAFPERLPVADKSYFLRGFADSTVIQTSMREYGQKYDVLLPQLGLPGDNRAEHGYANRGDALNFSPLLFEKYLEMAASIASSDRLVSDSPIFRSLIGLSRETRKNVTRDGGNDVVPLSASFAARDRIGKQAAKNDSWHASFVSELTDAFERGSGGTFDIPPSLNNKTIVGKGGLLKLRIQDDVLVINPNTDIWLASFATADATSGDHLLTNRHKGEKVFELTFQGDGEFEPHIRQLGVCVLARRNQSGTVRLSAVLDNGQRILREAVIAQDSGNVFFSWVAPPGNSIRKLAVDGSEFSGDYVLLDDIGFIFDNHQKLVVVPTKSQDLDGLKIDERVAKFLERAYRREVTTVEVQSAMNLIDQHTAAGASEADAIRRLVQTVLASPEFLFLAEPVREDNASVRPLDSYELANRLSYFLWSSMPDDELLAAAKSGTLQDGQVLRTQVQRMIADRPHSRELSESFAVQWLRLDQLFSSKPDRKLFKSFYSGPQGKSTLHGPMMIEALLLFETVVTEDRSILDLYDPSFTWLNQQLADLYGLNDAYLAARQSAAATGSAPEAIDDRAVSKYWFRTSLPDRTRGGVMTMAGPLTLTSLPFRTSPIKRGAWLLETVFNRPPSEPKVAFVLEEAVSDKGSDSKLLTVRQLFEQHRSDPNCYSCHSRIDPPGFSLEVFDAMGSLRNQDGDQPVDASGTWNNQQFVGPSEFKDALRANEQELVRGFVEHLLSYALGRRLEHFDMQAVEQIVKEAAQNEYRISSIIEGIVHSYPFRHVRNLP